MAGGLFAIERNYFWEIGSYDEQVSDCDVVAIEQRFNIHV
jgi:hypothetical protein